MKLLSANLQAFVMICEHGTVLSAAHHLKIGQTAATQRIKNLEAELGVTLFVRKNSGMTLTDEGRTLLRYCKNAQDSERMTLSEMNHLGQDRDVELVIAGPTSFMSSRAVQKLIPVMKKWPKLNLRFWINDDEDKSMLLKSGMVDFVVMYPHQVKAEFASKLVDADEYLLLCTTEWQHRDLEEILTTERLYAFYPEDQTSINYLKHFKLYKFVTRPRLYANENKTLSELLCHGIGYGLLEKNIAAPLLKSGKLMTLNDGKTLKDKLAVAWYHRDLNSACFADVLKQLIHC